MGHVIGYTPMPSTSSTSPMSSNGSRPGRSILFTNVKMGICRILQTRKSFFVCASTPFALSSSMMAASVAISARYVSSLKSAWPGVSTRLRFRPL